MQSITYHTFFYVESRASAEFGEVAKFGNVAKYSEVKLLKYGIVAEYSEVNLLKYGIVAISGNVFLSNGLFNATMTIFCNGEIKYCSVHFCEEEL